MGAPAHHHPPTDPQHDYELRAPVCVLPSHSPLKTSPASRRVAHVLKLQRRMTAGPREALARAAPAPDLYNPQARASVDDLVIDAVGTLRGAWQRPRAAGLGASVVGAQVLRSIILLFHRECSGSANASPCSRWGQ